MGWDMVVDVDVEEKIETVEMCGDVQREEMGVKNGMGDRSEADG